MFEGNVVVCPAELEVLFKKIMKSTTAPDESAAGIYKAWNDILVGMIVNPNLTYVNDWYLFAAKEAMKPLIYQSRKPAQFVALDKPTDESVFLRKKIMYSVEMRGNAGYGYYEMGFKVVNT